MALSGRRKPLRLPRRGRSPATRRDRSAVSSRTQVRSRSARGDDEALPTKVSDLSKALKDGWKLQDQLGVGDCGWRAIADNIAFQTEGRSLSVAEATHEGNKLRVSAVQHIKRHRSRYVPAPQLKVPGKVLTSTVTVLSSPTFGLME